MGLNCKEGELAFVIRSTTGSEGAIVRVQRYFGHAKFKAGFAMDDCWLVEGRVRVACKRSKALGADACVPDAWLRPIRPGDLTQEDVDALYLPQVIKQRDPEAA